MGISTYKPGEPLWLFNAARQSLFKMDLYEYVIVCFGNSKTLRRSVVLIMFSPLVWYLNRGRVNFHAGIFADRRSKIVIRSSETRILSIIASVGQKNEFSRELWNFTFQYESSTSVKHIPIRSAYSSSRRKFHFISFTNSKPLFCPIVLY